MNNYLRWTLFISLLLLLSSCMEDIDIQMITLDMERYIGTAVLPLDNGYMIAGFSHIGDYKDNFMLAHLDVNNTLIWHNTFESTTLDSVSDLIQTDEGFIMVGTSRFFGIPEAKVRVVKTTEEGKLVWSRTYPLYRSFTTGESIFAVEGGYIVGGTYIEEYKNAYIMKLDYRGNNLWMKTYKNRTDLHDMKTTENGFILVGSIDFTDYSDAVVQGNSTQYTRIQSCVSADSSNKDVWVQEIDQNGHVLWTQHYDNDKYDSGESILVAEDGFLIAGNTSDGKNYDFWIIKIDQEGNILWSQTYDHNTDLVYDLVEIGNEYIIGGNTRTINYEATDLDSAFGETNILIVCIDKLGREKWRKIIGDPDKSEIVHSICTVNDHVIFVGGLVVNDVDKILICIYDE
ncbi:MAG: hypothetical protein PVG65_03765 [Candidatus Thorarchaeota archaeon]